MVKVKDRETQDGLEESFQLTGIPAGGFEVNARNSERIKHELTEEERSTFGCKWVKDETSLTA